MCIQSIKIRSKNYLMADDKQLDGVRILGPSVSSDVFAKCGHCEDCYNSMRYAWAWRLASDIQYRLKQGWLCAFVTLTYDDGNLPRFPLYLECGVENPLAGQPCFLKKDIKDFIGYIKKIGNRERGLKELLYFVASEYGPSTKRPHYHLIISWSPEYYSGPEMHMLIKKYWFENPVTHRGFITPKDFEGGENRRKGKKILPFLIQDSAHALKSAFYTAKYVTKDIYYMRDLSKSFHDYKNSHCEFGLSFNDFCKQNKEYLPFHLQTRSLGFASIKELSDTEKLDIMLKGKTFVSDNKLSMPPLYIQNKLMFSPKYIIAWCGKEGEKRLIRRELTEFALKYGREILQKKVDYYNTLFETMKDRQYWISSGIDDENKLLDIEYFMKNNNDLDLFGCSLGEAYVYYYGVKYQFCFTDKFLTYKNKYVYPRKMYSSIQIVYNQWRNIQQYFSYLMSFCKWQNGSVVDEDADFIRDLMNQLSA